MKRIFLNSCLLASLFSGSLFAQDSLEAGNRISVNVRSSVTESQSIFGYSYEVENKVGSLQSVWQFWLILEQNISVTNLGTPNGWRGSIGNVKNYFEVHWGSPGDADIAPNNTLTGFAFETTRPPGIVTFYAEGYHPAPSFPEGMAPDSLPGYDDLTPYGPGITGVTVGPVSFPPPFDSVAFVDTLLSYTTQSRTLDWITSQTTADKYVAYFDSVKYYLQEDEIASAVAVLEQVLTDAETDNGNTLTSEAYALIRFNTEYLIERLPEN